ncbi:Programmed cell death toxin MazF [hydrothermal vent metagenome]|uniref:Programmed cell death toxin MazF n=1 Tax=hydrothermal vent metagenome TaxID=652676 RepID=A0A3B1C1P0_9ZZZZ
MKSNYIPERGDIVWLDFNPQAGREQSGRRPALTISPKEYNQKVGLSIFCPITSNIKGYPFEVKIPPKLKIKGVILADHVKNLDWESRNAKYICKLPTNILLDVLGKLNLLIGIDH